MGVPSAWALDVGPKTNQRNNFFVTKYFKVPRIWTDFLARTKKWKNDMRFGNWNIRSLYRACAIKSVVEGLEKYKLDLAGVKRLVWKGRDIKQ
jgi:hypothetical protein